MGICFQFIDGQFLAFILPLEGSFTFSSLGLGVLLVWGMGGKRSEADLIHGHLEIVDVILGQVDEQISYYASMLMKQL